jgi:hypothetical protein
MGKLDKNTYVTPDFWARVLLPELIRSFQKDQSAKQPNPPELMKNRKKRFLKISK